jgi:hypothetical protein
MYERKERPLKAEDRTFQSKSLKKLDAPVQRFNVGWVPNNPAHYRTTTTALGSTNATSGGAPFGDRRYAVEGNNQTNAATGGGNVVLPDDHLISDVGNFDMPNYQQARAISPECDHIVPQAEFGANDLANGRMISKGQNTNADTPRPHAPAHGGSVGGGDEDVRLKIYTPMTLTRDADGSSKVFNTGDTLSLLETRALASYAGSPFGLWNECTNDVLGTIQGAGNGTNNGYTAS